MNEEIVTKLSVVFDVLQQLNNSRQIDGQLMAFAKKNLLDTSDLTMLFQNSRRTIQRWRDTRKLKYSRVSGRCYYLWNNILPLMNSEYKLNGGLSI